MGCVCDGGITPAHAACIAAQISSPRRVGRPRSARARRGTCASGRSARRRCTCHTTRRGRARPHRASHRAPPPRRPLAPAGRLSARGHGSAGRASMQREMPPTSCEGPSINAARMARRPVMGSVRHRRREVSGSEDALLWATVGRASVPLGRAAEERRWGRPLRSKLSIQQRQRRLVLFDTTRAASLSTARSLCLHRWPPIRRCGGGGMIALDKRTCRAASAAAAARLASHAASASACRRIRPLAHFETHPKPWQTRLMPSGLRTDPEETREPAWAPPTVCMLALAEPAATHQEVQTAVLSDVDVSRLPRLRVAHLTLALQHFIRHLAMCSKTGQTRVAHTSL